MNKIEETILQKYKLDWLDYYFFHQIGTALGYEEYKWSSLDLIAPLLMVVWQLRHIFRCLKLARKQGKTTRTIKSPPKPRPTSLKAIKEAVKKAPPKRVTAQALRNKTYKG